EMVTARGKLASRDAELRALRDRAILWRNLPRAIRASLRSAAKLLRWTVTLQLVPRLRARQERRLVASSGLFDPVYYLGATPDVAAAGGAPLLHFFEHGAEERRNPNQFFDTGWYLAQYPDVARSRMNPLLHYLRHGAPEGRRPSPF